MIRFKIGIDIDSVVCEPMPAILYHINKKYNIKMTIDDIKQWDFGIGDSTLYENIMETFNDHELVENLPTVEYAPLGVSCLANAFDIIFITSRRDVLIKSTERWVKKKIGNYKVFHTGPEEDKNGYHVNILIDDAPHHIKDFADKGGWAIVFDRPWNRNMEWRSGIFRARNWFEVIDIIIKIEEMHNKKWCE